MLTVFFQSHFFTFSLYDNKIAGCATQDKNRAYKLFDKLFSGS